MPLPVACWCLSRLMRHCFLGRWTCPPVSESYHLVWRCRLGSKSFSRILTFCEMRTELSWIWIRFTVSISYDDNHYNMCATINTCVRMFLELTLHRLNAVIEISALSATVIIVVNGIGEQISNPGRSCVHFTSQLCPWERHESISLQLEVNSRTDWVL